MSATQSAKSVVIVGGTGFVGRCLTRTLMSQGHHVRVVTRKKTTGAMPGFQPTELAEVAYESADAREAALAGSDALINLCGILHQSARQRFEDVHERLPAAWTQSAVRVGVQQVLHMSALRADMTEPPSAYLRSKAAGERAVCAHADAIAISVFRPSIIFGDGDNFFGQFAGMLKCADNQTSLRDKSYYTFKNIKNLFLGGVKINDLINDHKIKSKNLEIFLPSDPNSLNNIKLEVHYLGYFLKWIPQETYYYAVKNCGFKPRPFRTQGTYSKYNSI
ncbi:MAG: NAD-dependent epimerase/dehydratase family protein, partial [Arenicellales bacterium]